MRMEKMRIEKGRAPTKIDTTVQPSLGTDSKKLTERYFEIFQEYLKGNGESALSKGYEFARRAMVDGCSVLEMAEFHHEALRRVLGGQKPTPKLLQQSMDLFAACLSPFEMSHRGSQEGT